MDPTDTKELPREMSAADVVEETKADVEAVDKSVDGGDSWLEMHLGRCIRSGKAPAHAA